jgi:glycosyltransferase involved in cell wall biosynthesis
MADDTDRIVMTGCQTGITLGELYSNAGVFVLPSYHEGLSITALEALSYELPILLSEIPANREIALPDELFPVGDVRALARMINKHLVNPVPVSKNKMYLDRQKRLRTEFNWRHIARQTADVYKTLIRSC